jgi:hypothetical protein
MSGESLWGGDGIRLGRRATVQFFLHKLLQTLCFFRLDAELSAGRLGPGIKVSGFTLQLVTQEFHFTPKALAGDGRRRTELRFTTLGKTRRAAGLTDDALERPERRIFLEEGGALGVRVADQHLVDDRDVIAAIAGFSPQVRELFAQPPDLDLKQAGPSRYGSQVAR